VRCAILEAEEPYWYRKLTRRLPCRESVGPLRYGLVRPQVVGRENGIQIQRASVIILDEFWTADKR
jgi:hypothetical protein